MIQPGRPEAHTGVRSTQVLPMKPPGRPWGEGRAPQVDLRAKALRWTREAGALRGWVGHRGAALVLVSAAALLLAGCAGKPPAPDWQINARSAMDRAVQAYLAGDSRVEAQEHARARSEVARTGRADLLARVELMRCAARVASLEFEPCSAFLPLAQDAGAAERAYANHLAGTASPQEAALLPLAQREVATGAATAETLARQPEAWSRLVAAGVMLQAGRADPKVVALAVDTAAANGWRRPLLAWLQVQRLRAEAAGEVAAAAAAQRRIERVLESTPAGRR